MCSASLFLDPPQSGSATVRAVVSVGRKVVGRDELVTPSGAFQLLAGGVLGAATNVAAFGTECFSDWNSSGSPPACTG